MKIINDGFEMVPVGQLREHERNPRHGDTGAIAESIEANGFYGGVVAQRSSRKVLVGNHRFRVALEAGAEAVPVHWVDVDDDRALRILLADNRANDLASYDDRALADLLKEITLQTGTLDGTLFDGDALDNLLADLGENPLSRTEGEDDVPETPVAPVSVLGDLWLLGEHRVLCGDSTEVHDISRLMDGDKEEAIVTDPPYGVGVDYADFEDSRQNVAALVSKVMPMVMNAPCAVLTPGIPSMWLYPQPTWLMAWIHPAPSGSCPWGFAGVNPILAYGKDPYLAAGLGRRPDSIVSASDREGVTGHPTPKPMNVWKWLVERVTPRETDLVLDLFGGSGTTLIACEVLRRTARLMELAPEYVDVIVNRWQTFTGKEATLDGDGRTFAEITAERAKPERRKTA